MSDAKSHLLTCWSAGVMLALYASNPSHHPVALSVTYKELAQSLPYLQLQIDVRGKITIIEKQVTMEVGEIKRNAKQYSKAKQQLVERARLLQWAIKTVVHKDLNFVLIGHLFLPRAKLADVPKNEVEDGISIFVHQL